ncbi:hypothetical protein V1515DRAFT_596912, partial [Lipomyces mesembrius]
MKVGVPKGLVGLDPEFGKRGVPPDGHTQEALVIEKQWPQSSDLGHCILEEKASCQVVPTFNILDIAPSSEQSCDEQDVEDKNQYHGSGNEVAVNLQWIFGFTHNVEHILSTAVTEGCIDNSIHSSLVVGCSSFPRVLEVNASMATQDNKARNGNEQKCHDFKNRRKLDTLSDHLVLGAAPIATAVRTPTPIPLSLQVVGV